MGAFAALICAVAIIVLIYGVMEKVKSGRLAKTPFAQTGEVATRGDQVAGPKGAVSVEGDVVCDNLLTSPVTGTECLYYELKVVGTWKDGDSTKSKDYVDEKSAAIFGLDDGSGQVAIRASKGGDFDPFDETFNETKKEGFFADLKGAVGKGEPIMFGNYAFENPPMSKANKFQCIEKVMKPQARLFALGKHEGGALVAPGWRALILSHEGREGLVGSTAKRSKQAFMGGGAGLGVGLILGIISMVMAPAKPKTAPAHTAAGMTAPATAGADKAVPAKAGDATKDADAAKTAAAAPKVSHICQRAIRCCEVLRGAGDAHCEKMAQNTNGTCHHALLRYMKAVRKHRRHKISACY